MEHRRDRPRGKLDIPRGFVEVDLSLPPKLPATFGYPGVARYVGFHWQPIGDELNYDDGRLAGTGAWHPFLTFISHLAISPALAPFNLGHSDAEPDPWLIVDQKDRRAFVAVPSTAHDFLAGQHALLPKFSGQELERIRQELEAAIARRPRQPPSACAIERYVAAQQEAVRRMVEFLDQHGHDGHEGQLHRP